MENIWMFLQQTAAASLVALFLLILQRIFLDKLSPRWQYGVWAILALRALLPAGLLGRTLVPGGRVRAVGEATLPMGGLGGVNGQSRVVHLTAGDYAVLVSDGLLVDGAGWVAKQVELSAAAGDAPEKLAETLVQTARIRAQKTGRPDDITAAVLRLEKSG